jgi:hypothetical protein
MVTGFSLPEKTRFIGASTLLTEKMALGYTIGQTVAADSKAGGQTGSSMARASFSILRKTPRNITYGRTENAKDSSNKRR